jgi:hypothetical protein
MDTGDLLAEHEAQGGVDPTPDEVFDPEDPSHVKAYEPATPVEGE